MGGSKDPQLADLRMRAYIGAAKGRPWWQTALLIAGCGVLGGVTVIAMPRLIPGAPLWVAMGVIVVTIAGLATWRSARMLSKRHAGAVELFLREGRCPGCSYVLDGVPAEGDGCVVCPECGAAWSGARVGSASAEAPALREYRRRIYQPTGRERWIPGMRGLLVTMDDRGKAANVTNPRLRGMDEATAVRIGAERTAAIRKASGWNGRGRGVAFALAMLPGLFMFGRMMVRPPTSKAVPATLFAMAVFVFSLLIVVLLLGLIVGMLFGDAGLSPRRVARAFVKEGVCPQCLGEIEGERGEDGVVVCAGCGAGWKAERLAGA
jgi:ribosomal protein L37AE/L43A